VFICFNFRNIFPKAKSAIRWVDSTLDQWPEFFVEGGNKPTSLVITGDNILASAKQEDVTFLYCIQGKIIK